jgi:hypothetical protein
MVDKLKYLSTNGLIQNDRERLDFIAGVGHIPRNSPVLPIFLSNWRQLGVQKSLKLHDQNLHFTNVQTIGRADVQKLIELGKQFIQKAKLLCDGSASEDVAIVNLDLFVP